jgi:hypothetical protein
MYSKNDIKIEKAHLNGALFPMKHFELDLAAIIAAKFLSLCV